MPWLLWPSFGWASPAVAVLITFLLLGVENIGVQVRASWFVVRTDITLRSTAVLHARALPAAGLQSEYIAGR